MIEAGLFQLLANAPAIQSALGVRVGSDTGIYPLLLPEGSTLPALTYQIVAASARATQTTSGLQRWRAQLDCWAATYLQAITLREAVDATLNGYQGTLSDGTNLQNAEALQRIDFFESAPRTYRAMIEFYLYFDFQ